MNRSFWFLAPLFAVLLAPTDAWEASVSQNVAVTVTAGTQMVGLSPATLTFASLTTGASSAAQPITVTNTGGVAFPLSSVAITGTNSGDFSQTNTCSTSVALAVSATCQISVVFKPTASGNRTASVVVSATGGGTYPSPPSPPLTLSGIGAAANGVPAAFFGMQYQGNYPTVSFGLMGKGSGVGWPYVQSARGVFDGWGALDGYVSQAKTHNLPFIYTFETVPGWSVKDWSSGCAKNYLGIVTCAKKPDSMTDLTNFMAAFLTRYCPSGVTKIQYFELYNEPYNLVGDSAIPSTQAQLPAADLATMSHAMYGAIKASCPAMKIISPNLGMETGNTGWSAGYLQSYFTALGPVGTDPVDVVSVHKYTNESGSNASISLLPENSLIPATSITLAATYAAGKPVWNTEGSWGRNTLTVDQAAGFIARWHLMHWSNGYASMEWYQWENGTYGTLCTDATPCAPFPIPTAAYTQTYNWMVGRTMPSACSQSGTVWSCVLTGAAATAGVPCAASTTTLAVWDTSGSSSYTPPSASSYAKYCDLAGATTSYPGSGAVTIGIKPILFGN